MVGHFTFNMNHNSSVHRFSKHSSGGTVYAWLACSKHKDHGSQTIIQTETAPCPFVVADPDLRMHVSMLVAAGAGASRPPINLDFSLVLFSAGGKGVGSIDGGGDLILQCCDARARAYSHPGQPSPRRLLEQNRQGFAIGRIWPPCDSGVRTCHATQVV